MKYTRHLLILILFLSISCENELKETTTNVVSTPSLCTPSHPELQESQYQFNGLESIDEVTQTSLKLNWTHVEGFQMYHIIEVLPEGRKIIKSVNSPTTEFTIKGLTPDKEYTYMVKALDKQGYSDINLAQLTTKTLPWPYFNNQRSLSFNGSQSINIGNSSTFKLKDKISFSLWFKTGERHSHEARLITLHSKTDPSTAISIGVQGEKVFSKFTDKNNILRTFEINSNYFDMKWHHIGLSFNGNLYSLYLDGDLIAKYRGSLTGLGTAQAHIASFSGIQKGFVGRIDEVAIFKTSLNKKDFSLIFNNAQSDNLLTHRKKNHLVSWYQFGDDPKDSRLHIEDVVGVNHGKPLNITNSSFVLDTP